MSPTESHIAPTAAEAWPVVQDMPELTRADVMRLTGMTHHMAGRALARWEAAGKVHLARSEGMKRIYRPTEHDVSAVERHAAELRGQRKPTPQDNLWRSMRMLREFTPIDLVAVSSIPGCEVDEKKAIEFCRTCLKGGYLRVVQKARPGRRPARYRLIRDTGPKPPRHVRLTAVWDDNEGRLVHVPGVEL